jgi:hypothetical protein
MPITYRFITRIFLFIPAAIVLLAVRTTASENGDFNENDLGFRAPTLYFANKTSSTLSDRRGDHHNPSSSLQTIPPLKSETQPGLLTDIARIFDPLDLIPEQRLSQSLSSSAPHDLFRNENKGLGSKLLRGSALIQSTQGASMAIMLVLPESLTNYSCRSWAEAKRNLHRAWSQPPVWDSDSWEINFVGHPYVGSIYYNALRSQGASARTSFLFSLGQSLFWEYGIEAMAEQPSIQDMLFTSSLGLIVGELSHRATIRLGRNGFSTLEKIAIMLINPAYVANNGFNKRHSAPSPIF